MTTLSEVIESLCLIEEKLAIEEPSPAKVVTAHRFNPSVGDDLETPCFMNAWRLISHTPRPNNQRQLVYMVRMQLFIEKSEVDSQERRAIATAMNDAFISGIDAQIKLNKGDVTLRNLRSAEGAFMPGLLHWNTAGYVGLEYLIDVTINDETVFGP